MACETYSTCFFNSSHADSKPTRVWVSRTRPLAQDPRIRRLMRRCVQIRFRTGFTNESENPVVGNNSTLFSKQLAQLLILKTDLNQLIKMVPEVLGFFSAVHFVQFLH